jgi:large conductance mechanosensitive channel
LFKSDFNDLKWVIAEGTVDETGKIVGEISVLYGEFLTNTIDFLIVAFVMFIIVKAVNKLKREEPPAPPAGPTQEELLAEIRDLLKKQ